MVGAPLTSPDSDDLSASEGALAHEASLRLALRDVADTVPESADRTAAVVRTTQAMLSDHVVQGRPLLRAMRDAVLAATTLSGHHPAASSASISYEDEADAVARAARALDDFVSVCVIGARAKASAFFDQMIVHTEWTRIAVVAGSSVAEAAFLAVNHPKKTLTVLDIPPRWPGRAMADKLAWQTGAAVRYASVTAAHRALEGIDVVVMGAREVLANGAVVVGGGSAIVAHMAQEAGVPVVVTAQAAKLSERGSVQWAEGDADVLRAREVQRLVTEMDSAIPDRASVWRTDLAPELLRKRESIGTSAPALSN